MAPGNDATANQVKEFYFSSIQSKTSVMLIFDNLVILFIQINISGYSCRTLNELLLQSKT
jgi:hypothetical protein